MSQENSPDSFPPPREAAFVVCAFGVIGLFFLATGHCPNGDPLVYPGIKPYTPPALSQPYTPFVPPTPHSPCQTLPHPGQIQCPGCCRSLSPYALNIAAQLRGDVPFVVNCPNQFCHLAFMQNPWPKSR